MKAGRSLIAYARVVFVILGLALPMLLLMLLGSVWLWQQGYLLHWALFTCAITILAYLLQFWLFRDVRPQDLTAAEEASAEAETDPSWTPREAEAWEAVKRLASEAPSNAFASRDAAIALGLRTVETVALRLHPKVHDPLWQFTAPEALALIEQVSSRLRSFINDSFPLGDRLTVAQIRRLYRWRGVIGAAERAYDIWRVARLLNPATAATQELRERLSKKMLELGKDYFTRRLTTVYVEEIGRAAIDLYSGRMRILTGGLAKHVSEDSECDAAAIAARMIEPIRILVAGQVGAGKSSLINALSNEIQAAVDALPTTGGFTAFTLKRENFPAAVLIDSPAIAGLYEREAIIEEATECDLLLWVSAAHRADREIDLAALAALREHFAARPNRRQPPIILVLTHIDRLRPFQEWKPPYDLTSPDEGKAASIRAAVEAVAKDLGLSEDDVVPVCLQPELGCYNVDAVWGKAIEVLPQVQRTHLVRRLREAENRWDWKQIWSQVKKGGRVLAEAMMSRR